VPADYLPKLQALNEEGRRSDAVDVFFTDGLGMQPEAVAGMHDGPFWPELEKVAPTIAYDAAFMEGTMQGRPLPADRWASIGAPALVMDGGASPTFLHTAAEALAAVLPSAGRSRDRHTTSPRARSRPNWQTSSLAETSTTGERMPAAVGYLVIDTTDADRLVPFWCGLLGVQVHSTFADGQFIILSETSSGLRLTFQRVAEQKVVKNRLHLDLLVEDLDAATAEVETLGGRWLEPGTMREIDGFRWRTMADPEGNEFDIIPDL